MHADVCQLAVSQSPFEMHGPIMPMVLLSLIILLYGYSKLCLSAQTMHMHRVVAAFSLVIPVYSDSFCQEFVHRAKKSLLS